jgi:tetratricopeptide (TPR) repeat protein
MMSSVITKANKGRSPASQKLRSTKAKKAVSKKPQRPGKITAAPKSKKAVASKKKEASARKATPSSKKAAPKKKLARAAPSQKSVKTKKPVASGSKRVGAKAGRGTAKPAPPPKKAPSTLAAVQAFEQALKSFNRHDYASARSAFDALLQKFGDQSEIVARARTYLAICDQRLARAPAPPRNPDALYDQGVFLLNKGETREAIELFEKALRTEPRADHIHYSLSAAYARLADSTRALDALRRAISIRSVHRSHARRDPDFASLHTNEEFQRLTGFGFEFIEE